MPVNANGQRWFTHWVANIRQAHPRTATALLNSLASLLIKGGSLVISLLTVPLTLRLLGNTTFGVWTTISSLVAMLALFDVGLGNGLRNRLAEALAHKDPATAKSYVTTAYAFFGLLQGVLIFFFWLANSLIPWGKVLNTTLDTSLLGQLAFVLFVGSSLKLLLDLLTAVLHAHQQSAKTGLLTLSTNALTLIGISYLVITKENQLITLGFVTAAVPIVVLLIASLWAYRGPFRVVSPALQAVNWQRGRALLSLGGQFFIIQLAVIIIFYSDNLIITQLFGPEHVTPYTISFRYFNLITALFGILLTPLWSAFTEAYAQGDFTWMRTTYKRLLYSWLAVFGLVVIWVLAAPTVYACWVGDQVAVPRSLDLGMALSVLVACYNNVTVVVVNGLSKIRLQLLSAIASSILNIPLAIIFGNYFGMGSVGVIFATSLSLLVGSVVCTIQARRLLDQTATGIWNQ